MGLSLYLSMYDRWVGRFDSGVPSVTTPYDSCDYKGPRYTLTTLPLEMIVEIMKHLDWHSVLSLSGETTPFALFTLIFMVFCYSLDVQASRRRFEGPISLGSPIPSFCGAPMRSSRLENLLELHSAHGLDQWVLVRRSADSTWGGKDMKFHPGSKYSAGLRLGALFQDAAGSSLVVWTGL